ncbi:MAG TPA: NADPH:quinone oxidoreductase family protein [Nevskiaceae bacterium]|nr:NADPH:quinone oxidoreductase family protein [Nevskiaceae bacterium]
MKAVVCRELGGPEHLMIEDCPRPTPNAGEVLIQTTSAGINFPDTLQIAGRYQTRLDPPFVPGAEVAGRVVEVGTGVKRLKVGDAVAALLPTSGGFAEFAKVNAALCLSLPAQLDLKDAGGFPLVYGTVLHALRQRGQLQPGETLLVLGASGGVGLAAVQVGKLLGARVLAAASTSAKRELCLQHGADEVVDYAKLSLKDEVKRLTGKHGADVIFDPVGDRYARDCLSSLAWKGRWLIIGFAGGEIPAIPANLLLLKGAAAVGVFWGSFAGREPAINAENFAQLFTWVAAGRLRPVVSHHYPLAQAGQALRDMLERRVTGKIVLVP